MKATPALVVVTFFCAAFAGCDNGDEPAEGTLGALCFTTDPADTAGNCSEGIDPRCAGEAGLCGLGPPLSGCDDRARCVECGGDDPDPLCPPPPPPQAGEACDVDARCASGLACVEAVALAGGTCREVPDACAADLCACPGDDLAPLCGARPNDCEGSFIACDGVYADP